MEMTFNTLGGLPEAARRLLAALPANGRVLAFHGPMGVGKTTFIAALCRELGVVEDEVNSPTFAIVNMYQGADSEIYHFDFYRLEDESQALDIGAEDYLYSGAWCFVEWPENAPGILPAETVHVYMEELADGSRKMEVS